MIFPLTVVRKENTVLIVPENAGEWEHLYVTFDKERRRLMVNGNSLMLSKQAIDSLSKNFKISLVTREIV